MSGALLGVSLSLNSTVGALRLNRLTTVQRDALTPLQGMTIFNTTDAQVQDYNGTAWVAAAGDVVGPGSATDNAVARYDGATGNLIQNSTVLIDDLGKVTIPAGGGLVVDTDTLIVDATNDQVSIGNAATPLTDLTIFQGSNNTKGLTFAGQSLFGNDNTDGVSIFLGANLVNNRQLFFTTFSDQGTTGTAFRFIFGSALPNIGGVTANGTTRMALTFGDETDGNIGFGFTLAAVQADIKAKLHIDTGVTTKIGLIVQGKVSQTADLFQARNSADVNLLKINSTGILTQLVADGRGVHVASSTDVNQSTFLDFTNAAGARSIFGCDGNGLSAISRVEDTTIGSFNGSAGGLNFFTAASFRGRFLFNGDFEVDTNTLYVDASASSVGIGTTTPNSKLEVQGSLSVKRVATAVSVSTIDEVIIGVTDTTVGRTVTISTADIVLGRMFIIKDESGAASNPNPITIDTEGAQLIDGVASVQISVAYGVVRLYSNGTNLFSW